MLDDRNISKASQAEDAAQMLIRHSQTRYAPALAAMTEAEAAAWYALDRLAEARDGLRSLVEEVGNPP